MELVLIHLLSLYLERQEVPITVATEQAHLKVHCLLQVPLQQLDCVPPFCLPVHRRYCIKEPWQVTTSTKLWPLHLVF